MIFITVNQSVSILYFFKEPNPEFTSQKDPNPENVTDPTDPYIEHCTMYIAAAHSLLCTAVL